MRHWRLASLWIGCVLAAAGACAIDQSGGLAPDASSVDSASDIVAPDVGPKDVQIDVPVACSTLDATACVPTALPSGWTFAVVAAGDASCPVGDYEEEVTFATAPTPNTGACVAQCSPTGAYTCAGQIEAGSTPGCTGKWFIVDAGNTTACFDTGWNDPHIGVPLATATSAGAGCTINDNGTHTFNTSTVTACTPGCSADYCGLTGTFERCVVTTTQSATLQTCPSPFTQGPTAIGASGNVTLTCAGGVCVPAPSGPCTATLNAYTSDNCSSTALNDAALASGTCYNLGGGNNVNSFQYVPVVPTVQCSVSSDNVADASFTQSLTLCCLP